MSHGERAYFEPRFGRDLSHVRLHTDTGAGGAARGIGARAYTYRNHIAFAPGQYQPATTEGRRLIAHELTHTFQQGRGGAVRRDLIEELTAPLPSGATEDQQARHRAVAAARQNLRVQTGQVDMQIDDLFSTQGGRTTIGLPQNTTVRFEPTIPAALHHGLRNVAATLSGDRLTGNMTVTIALDLSSHGGRHALYRFTQLELGNLGREILVDHVGDIGAEDLTEEQRTAMRQRFDGFGFRRSGFSQDEFDQVLIGLSRVPDGQLSGLGALRFRRETASATTPQAEAEYQEDAHTIEVYDGAFESGMVRAGIGNVPVTQAAASVIHEVGHALDQSAVHQARVPLRQAQADILREFGTGGTGYEIPARDDPRRARFDELNSQLQAAQTAEGSARLLSGARVRSGTITDALPRGWRTPAFRRAAQQDGANAATGAGFPTTYPNPDSYWQEYFAESFMLYQTQPDLLEQIRPHVFAYMQTQFPAQGAAAPTQGGTNE